jgi:hypothetical protein
MRTHKNSRSQPDVAESHLNDQSLVKKWRIADSNIIFEQNQKLVLLPLKCKSSPVPVKSVGACAKFKIYLQRCHNEIRADICILDSLLFMWGVLPSFRFRVSVAASQKKPDFGTLKIEKALFVGGNKNWSRGIPCHPNGHARVWYSLIPTNYAMIGDKPSSFDLKVMLPRTWLVISMKGLSCKLLFSRFNFFSRI